MSHLKIFTGIAMGRPGIYSRTVTLHGPLCVLVTWHLLLHEPTTCTGPGRIDMIRKNYWVENPRMFGM
jgi:hypothetical protein